MTVNSRTRRRTTKPLLHSDDLPAVARHYCVEFQADASRELRFFEIQRSFADAITKAALAQRPDGKRFSHQHRIPRVALERARQCLIKAEAALANAPTFDVLLNIIEQEISSVPKIGELTVYDTALRIAAWRRLEPEMVYLHAGTRDGAKALGLDVSQTAIPVSQIPRGLRRLRPREIEDVLCIYKDVFRRRRPVPSKVRCS